MELKLNAELILEFVKRIFIGTSASTLMKIGAASLAFGMWDVAIYFFDSYVLEKNVQHPGDSLGWMQIFGLSCFFLGLFIRLKQYHKENNFVLRSERLNFKLNDEYLADVELQDEFERLYSTRNADIRGIKIY